MGNDFVLSDFSSPSKVQRCLLDQVCEKLKTVLEPEFAPIVPKVVALAKQRLKNGSLSLEIIEAELKELSHEIRKRKDWLTQKKIEGAYEEVKSVADIGDPLRIAEYRNPETSINARQKIRNYYWEANAGYVAKVSRLLLIHYCYQGEREAEILSDQVESDVVVAVFSDTKFLHWVSQYEPLRGKTFGNYIKMIILSRAIDACRILKPRIHIGDDLDPDTVAHLVPNRTNEDIKHIERQAFYSCMDKLVIRHSPKSRIKGIEELAAFELRYKADLPPDYMHKSTLDLVKERSGTTKGTLTYEHQLAFSSHIPRLLGKLIDARK